MCSLFTIYPDARLEDMRCIVKFPNGDNHRFIIGWKPHKRCETRRIRRVAPAIRLKERLDLYSAILGTQAKLVSTD